MAMNEITKNKVKEIMSLLQDTLCYLYNRWQDEKEYENWNDYIAHMKKAFENMESKVALKSKCFENAYFVKASKRPFGMTFDLEGWRVVLSVTSTQYKWIAKKL